MIQKQKSAIPAKRDGTAGLLCVLFVGFQEIIQLGQEGITVNAMDHTGLFHGLAAGSRSAKAVHADFHKVFACCWVSVKNCADVCLFCYNHWCSLLFIVIVIIITILCGFYTEQFFEQIYHIQFNIL